MSLLFVILVLFYLLTSTYGRVATSDDIAAVNRWSNNTFEKVNHQSMRKLYKTMKTWSKVHFGETKIPVMYFFSGADLYTLMGLFPQAPAYGLVAEFFPGDIKCFQDEQCSNSAFVKAASWYSHVETRSFGYSVTVSMRNFFAAPLGILPAILLILRTLNFLVIGLETTDTGFTIKTNRATICYEKKFILNVDALQEVLSLKSMPPKPWAVMFKAGAHEVARRPWFTNNILSNSVMVVQDETGLRATAFSGNWAVKVYGEYHPFTGNGTRFVEDMEEFKTLFHRKSQPLPFCFGYCSEYHTRGGVATSADIAAINLWSNETVQKVDHQSMKKLQTTMTIWAGVHFGEPKIPVAYFFSGADLYTMMGLFPRAPAFLLIAEFFPGDFVCFRDPSCAALATKLAVAWYDHVETRAFGYSVTASMLQYFARPTGILPAILLILKIFGHTVVGLETTKTGFSLRTNMAVICYENRFITDADDLKEILSLKSMPPRPWAVMFKAGAHDVARQPWFTNIILETSAVVIQDETGLRASAFKGDWVTKVYGQYHPFTGNGTRFTEDMAEIKALFHKQRSSQQPLPFCYGYCREYHTHGMLLLAENLSLFDKLVP